MLIALCQSHALAAVSVLPSSWREWSKLHVWLSCSKYVDYSLFTLSEWLICISLYTLFTKMVCSSKSERAQTKNIMGTAHPRGVASHPIHPPPPPPPPPRISPWLCLCADQVHVLLIIATRPILTGIIMCLTYSVRVYRTNCYPTMHATLML